MALPVTTGIYYKVIAEHAARKRKQVVLRAVLPLVNTLRIQELVSRHRLQNEQAADASFRVNSGNWWKTTRNCGKCLHI